MKKKKYQYDENGVIIDDWKSRSQKKRESTAKQDEAEALIGLSKSKLIEEGIHEDIIEAIEDYKKIASHEAKRRQMQYIGRLMRELA